MTATAKQPSAGTTDVPTFRHFVDGEWVESNGGGTFESGNPADTRDVIGRFQQGTAADVAMAVRSAETAFPKWKSIYVDFSGRLQRAQIDNQA